MPNKILTDFCVSADGVCRPVVEPSQSLSAALENNGPPR